MILLIVSAYHWQLIMVVKLKFHPINDNRSIDTISMQQQKSFMSSTASNCMSAAEQRHKLEKLRSRFWTIEWTKRTSQRALLRRYNGAIVYKLQRRLGNLMSRFLINFSLAFLLDPSQRHQTNQRIWRSLFAFIDHSSSRSISPPKFLCVRFLARKGLE